MDNKWTDYAIVETSVTYFQAGEEIQLDYALDCFVMWDGCKDGELPDHEAFTKKVTHAQPGEPIEHAEIDYIRLKVDAVALDFNIVGNGNDFSSGIGYEVDGLGAEWVFDMEKKELFRIARELKPKPNHLNMIPRCHFLTLWQHDTYRYSTMEGDEYDTDWRMVGPIDLEAVARIVSRDE